MTERSPPCTRDRSRSDSRDSLRAPRAWRRSPRQSRPPTSTSDAADDLQDPIGRFARYAFTLAAAIFVVRPAIALTGSGGLAALPTIFVIATHNVFVPNTSFDRVRISLAISWCAVAVAVAALNSRTLYGSRRQISEVRQLGQYTLQEEIGEGSMGVVSRATHAMLRRPAAIKLLLKGRTSETDLVRFEREVQLTSRRAQPNTGSIFDYGEPPRASSTTRWNTSMGRTSIAWSTRTVHWS